MTPDSHPNNPDLPKKTRLPAKATLSSEGNIEFDFQGPKNPGRFEKVTIQTDSEMIHDLQSEEAGESEEKRRANASNRLSFAHQGKKIYHPEKSNEETSTTSKPMPTLSPSPTISDFRRNTDRQRREQKSVSTLLSGVAYALIGGILLVGLLAGFGGYILWKQIQNQAVTVAQVDAKVDQQVAALKTDQELLKKFASDQSTFDIEVKEKLSKLSAVGDKLSAVGDKTSAAIRDEKDARTKDVAAIIKRLTRVEGRRAALTPGPGE